MKYKNLKIYKIVVFPSFTNNEQQVFEYVSLEMAYRMIRFQRSLHASTILITTGTIASNGFVEYGHYMDVTDCDLEYRKIH